MKVHYCISSAEAYDAIQTGEIPVGEVVVVQSEGVVGVSDTWPVAVTKARGSFHQISPGANPVLFEKLFDALRAAVEWARAMPCPLPLDPQAVRLAAFGKRTSPEKHCTCGNCGHRCPVSQLKVPLEECPDLSVRLEPGNVVPAGECNECRCLTYLDNEKLVPLLDFTVLLLYPDYIAENYGEDTYLAHVRATDALTACHVAQLQAHVANEVESESLDDYRVQLCIAGHHEAL